MNKDELINLPPLCRTTEKVNSPRSQCWPLKLELGATDAELPYVLRNNQNLLEHLKVVRTAQARILESIKAQALASAELLSVSRSADLANAHSGKGGKVG